MKFYCLDVAAQDVTQSVVSAGNIADISTAAVPEGVGGSS